jgi:hypothetical protein
MPCQIQQKASIITFAVTECQLTGFVRPLTRSNLSRQGTNLYKNTQKQQHPSTEHSIYLPSGLFVSAKIQFNRVLQFPIALRLGQTVPVNLE